MAAKSKGKMGDFFKGVRSELKRVSWPNKKELYSYTVVVVVVCVLVALGIWVADSVFRVGLDFLLK
ncbi:preprotein translocase subunit SecE [Clostridiaceae bacterium HSG29]|nr:preprotein translocase subunit SecE [Clostridiaceae bacterium HSG29]